MDLLWVGKFDFRKQLGLAPESCGSHQQQAYTHTYLRKDGIENCHSCY